MPSYQVASPPSSPPLAFIAVSLGIKPVCFCFNVLCRLKKASILIRSYADEAGKGIINGLNPLTATSGQTNCAEQQVEWTVSPVTRALLYPLANFSSSILLSNNAHTHPTSWIPQTHVYRHLDQRRVFLSSAPLFEVSRSSDHLAYFIKNTWDAAQANSLSHCSHLGAPVVSHLSSSLLTGRSWHVPFISTPGTFTSLSD